WETSFRCVCHVRQHGAIRRQLEQVGVAPGARVRHFALLGRRCRRDPGSAQPLEEAPSILRGSGDQNPTRLGLGYVAVPTRPGEIVQIDGATGRRVPGAKARVQRVVASTGAHGQPRALGEQLEHGPRVVVEAPGFPQVDRYLVADTVVASYLPERL